MRVEIFIYLEIPEHSFWEAVTPKCPKIIFEPSRQSCGYVDVKSYRLTQINHPIEKLVYQSILLLPWVKMKP